jgi:hypothetical protein
MLVTFLSFTDRANTRATYPAMYGLIVTTRLTAYKGSLNVTDRWGKFVVFLGCDVL